MGSVGLSDVVPGDGYAVFFDFPGHLLVLPCYRAVLRVLSIAWKDMSVILRLSSMCSFTIDVASSLQAP